MEAIFRLSAEKFSERMIDIKDEVEEAYDEDFLDENTILIITLMTPVFQYVKKYAGKYQNTLEMLRLLSLIKDSGEVRFIFDSQLVKMPVPWSPISLFAEAGSEKVKVCVINAAKWLEYYYRVYERAGKSLQDNRMVTREFVHILNTPLESKSEKKAEVGNVTFGCDEMFPIRLYNFLNDYIVGQDELKKRLSMVVYRYLKYGERNPLMMIGPSGSGKNYTMEILSRYEELHKELLIYTFDASNLTPSGFKGVNMEDIFSGFKSKCMAQRKPLTKGIIFLDEADKVINPNTDCNGENVSALVQHQLLSVIAGTSTVSGIDTKNILFILGGAFGRLYELQEARKK